MKFSVIVIAVWMQSYIEPGLIEVSSESTACAIFAKFHETWRSEQVASKQEGRRPIRVANRITGA